MKNKIELLDTIYGILWCELCSKEEIIERYGHLVSQKDLEIAKKTLENGKQF